MIGRAALVAWGDTRLLLPVRGVRRHDRARARRARRIAIRTCLRTDHASVRGEPE